MSKHYYYINNFEFHLHLCYGEKCRTEFIKHRGQIPWIGHHWLIQKKKIFILWSLYFLKESTVFYPSYFFHNWCEFWFKFYFCNISTTLVKFKSFYIEGVVCPLQFKAWAYNFITSRFWSCLIGLCFSKVGFDPEYFENWKRRSKAVLKLFLFHL